MGDTTAAGRIRAVADALTLASAQLAVARMLLDAGADPNGRTGEEYGVARLTANKALRLLVTEGLAVLSPRHGLLRADGHRPELTAWPGPITPRRPISLSWRAFVMRGRARGTGLAAGERPGNNCALLLLSRVVPA